LTDKSQISTAEGAEDAKISPSFFSALSALYASPALRNNITDKGNVVQNKNDRVSPVTFIG
jgi:hypothetical protein